MISDNFWKILFLLMVLTGLGFWYKNYSEKSTFKNLASRLADMIEFNEETLPRNDEEAQQRFIKAVALLQDAGTREFDTTRLLDAAFEYNGIGRDSAQAMLVRECLLDSLDTGNKLGIFNNETIWDLSDGQPVKITEGPFEGEYIAVTPIVRPEIGEGARYFLGNMLIVPASVAAIGRDIELTEKVFNTSVKLNNANVISADTAKAIKENFYLHRERSRY